MLDKNKIKNIVHAHFEGTDKFLVDVEISGSNIVSVFVDGDNGINIKECVTISRLIESGFDRDKEDFELRVSSPGLDRPFKLLRQYHKYLNKNIVIVTEGDKKISGLLKSVTDLGVKIEKRTGKKGKDIQEVSFNFKDIREAKPEISFNK